MKMNTLKTDYIKAFSTGDIYLTYLINRSTIVPFIAKSHNRLESICRGKNGKPTVVSLREVNKDPQLFFNMGPLHSAICGECAADIVASYPGVAGWVEYLNYMYK